MLWWIRFARPDGQRVANFFTLEDAWEITVKDEVLRLKPYLSSLQWHKRENREAASRWIQQIVACGYLEINNTLEAEHQPMLADLYLWQLGTEHFAYLPDASRSLLPFLKDLLNQVESHSESKIELTLQRLSPKQIQELERVVYYSRGYVSLLESDKERYDGTVDTGRSVIWLPHAHFPNGLPRDAVLVCKIETKDGVLSQRSGVGVWGRFYDVVDLQLFFDDSYSDREHLSSAARVHPELPVGACPASGFDPIAPRRAVYDRSHLDLQSVRLPPEAGSQARPLGAATARVAQTA
jgi:hypothetical protein